MKNILQTVLTGAVFIAFTSAPATAADLAAGKKTYDMMCASCHGATGKGDGPTGAALKPKARDFTDAAWQANTTDEKLKKVILAGGPANGLSPMMPPYAHIKGADLDNLAAYVRSFKPAQP